MHSHASGRSTDGIDEENRDEEESTDGDYILDDFTNSPDEAFVTIAQTTLTRMESTTTPYIPRAKAPQIEGDVSPLGKSKPQKLEKLEEERVKKEDAETAKTKTRGTRIIKKKVEEAATSAEKIVLHEVDEMTEDEDPVKVELTRVDATTGGGFGLKGKIRKIEKDGKSRISTIGEQLGPIVEESAEGSADNEKKTKEIAKSVPKIQTKVKTQRIPLRMTLRKSGKKEEPEMTDFSSEEVEEKKRLSLVVRKIEKPIKHTTKETSTTMKPTTTTTKKMEKVEKMSMKEEISSEQQDSEKVEREEGAAIVNTEEESKEEELETKKQKKIEAMRKEKMVHSREMKIHRVEKIQKKAKIEKPDHKYEKIVAADSEERAEEAREPMENKEVLKPKAQKSPIKAEIPKRMEESTEVTTTSEPEEDEAIVGVVSDEKTEKEEAASAESSASAENESSESQEKRKHEEAVDDTISLVGPPEDEKSGEEELKKVIAPSVPTTSIPTIETTLEVLSPVEKAAAGLTTTEAPTTPITVTETSATTQTVVQANTTTDFPTPQTTTHLQILKTRLEIIKNETSTETTDHRGVRLIKTSSGSIIEMAPRGTRRVVKKKKSGPVIIIKPKNEMGSQEGSEEVNRRTKKVKKVHKLKRVRVVHRNRNVAAAKDLPTEEKTPHLDEQKELVKKVDKEKKTDEESKEKQTESEEKEKTAEEKTKTTDWQYVTAPGERTAAPGVTLAPEASKVEDGETVIQEATDWDTFTSTQPGVVEELKTEDEESDYNEILGLTKLTTSASTTNQPVTNKRVISTPVEPSGYDMITEPVVINSPELPPTKPEEAVGYDGISKEEFRDDPAPKQDVLVSTDIKGVVKQEQERSADETKRGWIPYRFNCESEEDDKGPLCKEWALGGLCEQHKPTMFLFCRKTCLCTGPLARRRRNIQL